MGSAHSSLWSIQSTADVQVNTGMLSGVSCSGPDSCVAVGSYESSSGGVTLAEVWDGTSWSIDPTPNPPGSTNSSFAGISCPTSNACMAVGIYLNQAGSYSALAESWNGSSWTIQPTVNPKKYLGQGSLGGVSCISAVDCTAVGSYTTPDFHGATLAEVWNGTVWSLEKTLNPTTQSELAGVSCLATGECVAVGVAGRDTLAGVWNGTNWSIMKTRNPPHAGTSLAGVSCTSTSVCVAVGDYYAHATGRYLTLAESWDGTKWSIQTTPDPSPYDNYLSGVSCISATDCSAVGQAGNSPVAQATTLAEVWNGSTWSVQSTANPAGSNLTYLQSDSCIPPGSCQAVGVSRDSFVVDHTLVEALDGTTWSIESSPDPVGAVGNNLQSVSCTSSTWCAAVGIYGSYGPYEALSEIADGSSWSLEATPEVPGATDTELASVSCESSTFCTAVGWSFGDGDIATLAESWDGTAWSIVPTPNIANPPQLYGVSCPSPTSCLAVGYYGSTGGEPLPGAETWDGTAWSDQPAVLPPGAASAQLNSVSCVASTDRTAVGEYADSGGQQVALIENWDGSSWSVAPSASVDDQLTSVSCSSSIACAAVGYSDDTSEMLAETWDGTEWTVDATQSHSAWYPVELDGVSCTSANACTAVGHYGFLAAKTLFEAWDGTSWVLEKTPNNATPPGVKNSRSPYGSTFNSASCVATSQCTAVGDSRVGVSQAFAEAEG